MGLVADGELSLVDDRNREHRHPAAVLVSNDPYALHRPIVTGTRPSLTSGRLGILVIDRPDAATRVAVSPAGHGQRHP